MRRSKKLKDGEHSRVITGDISVLVKRIRVVLVGKGR